MTRQEHTPARVGVTGACGRMGGLIVRLVGEDPSLALGAALEAPGHARLGQDAGQIAGLGRSLAVPLAADFAPDAGLDVVVDFSLPAGTMAAADYCKAHKVPMVIGTTGLSDTQAAGIRQAAEVIPVVLSPNFSVGVNLLLSMVGHVARTLGDDYDCEIVEMHHRFKKDAPSGTALKLADAIARATGRDIKKDAVHGREGIIGERPRGEIGILALRGGDVVGDHTVTFAGVGERIELTHRASSRETFARGALRAAKFLLVGRKPRLYSMLDVLGL